MGVVALNAVASDAVAVDSIAVGAASACVLVVSAVASGTVAANAAVLLLELLVLQKMHVLFTCAVCCSFKWFVCKCNVCC